MKTLDISNRELCERLLRIVQKARSIIMETIEKAGDEPDEEVDMIVASDLYPVLFRNKEDPLHLINMLTATLKDDREVEDINVFNILYYCEKEPVIELTYIMWFGGEKLPTGMEFLRQRQAEGQ